MCDLFISFSELKKKKKGTRLSVLVQLRKLFEGFRQ